MAGVKPQIELIFPSAESRPLFTKAIATHPQAYQGLQLSKALQNLTVFWFTERSWISPCLYCPKLLWASRTCVSPSLERYDFCRFTFHDWV
jgi:hypothetical protein